MHPVVVLPYTETVSCGTPPSMLASTIGVDLNFVAKVPVPAVYPPAFISSTVTFPHAIFNPVSPRLKKLEFSRCSRLSMSSILLFSYLSIPPASEGDAYDFAKTRDGLIFYMMKKK